MICCTSFLYAQDAAYQQGLSSTSQPDVRGMSAGQVPGYSSSPLPEIDIASIGDAALQHQKSSEVGEYIASHQEHKQKFVIHDSDPFLEAGHKAAIDPHKVMNHVIVKEASATGSSELMTCEQGGEAYIQKCEKHLEIDIEVKPATYKTERYCNGHTSSHEGNDRFSYGRGASYNPYHKHWSPSRPRLIYVYDRENYGSSRNTTTYCQGCQSRTVLDQPKSVIVTREEWVNGCQTLEALADKGLCQCVNSEIGDKETRTLKDEPVTRDSWFEKYTYQCLREAKNTAGKSCEALAAHGCVQVSSRCIEKIGGVCVLYRQTYRYGNRHRKGASYRAVGDDKPFCLTGDCGDDRYEDNGDLFEVLSQLTVLRQVQHDIRSKIGIFSGQVRACRKHAIGFSDCCTHGGNPEGGWGQSWGLASCNAEERELADWRPQKKCVLVGTYCAEKEKLTGICLRKKTSYCCFGNKLSRLIQEQGRAQLGIGWEEQEKPECRGLTPEELSRLDMSQMDLSELFADVSSNFKPPSQDHIAKGVELDNIRANMKHMMSNLKKEAKETS